MRQKDRRLQCKKNVRLLDNKNYKNIYKTTIQQYTQAIEIASSK